MPGCIADQAHDREVGASCRLRLGVVTVGTGGRGKIHGKSILFAVAAVAILALDFIKPWAHNCDDERDPMVAPTKHETNTRCIAAATHACSRRIHWQAELDRGRALREQADPMLRAGGGVSAVARSGTAARRCVWIERLALKHGAR